MTMSGPRSPPCVPPDRFRSLRRGRETRPSRSAIFPSMVEGGGLHGGLGALVPRGGALSAAADGRSEPGLEAVQRRLGELVRFAGRETPQARREASRLKRRIRNVGVRETPGRHAAEAAWFKGTLDHRTPAQLRSAEARVQEVLEPYLRVGRRRGGGAKRKAWAAKADANIGRARLSTWAGEEQPAPIASVTHANGAQTVRPGEKA